MNSCLRISILKNENSGGLQKLVTLVTEREIETNPLQTCMTQSVICTGGQSAKSLSIRRDRSQDHTCVLYLIALPQPP
jgi:hypothetical protein